MVLSVSIIVPVYNVEEYIADCFQSIVNQTYTGSMECLFIDDCGDDNSVQILEGLINAYDGPIEMRLLHHEKNKGLSVARNTGIANAKGDYLFFLDSDDQLYPYSIASLSRAAVNENHPEIILGSYHVSDPDNSNNQYQYKYDVLNGQPAIADAFLKDMLFCMAHNKLVSREFILKNHLFFKEGIIHEDNLWSFQSFHIAKKVVTIPEKTYYYLIRSGSIMTSSSPERQLMSLKIISDEVQKDAQIGRYELIENDSLNYIKYWLKIKCGGLLNWIYMTNLTRKERISRLKSIPKDLMPLMQQYLFSDTLFMKSLKCLLKLGLYGMFDTVMNKLYSVSKKG